MKRKNIFLFLLLCLPKLVVACTGYVVGFKGKNDAFDMHSFNNYVTKQNYCGKVYSWNQHGNAINFISLIDKPYQLYGYSKGVVGLKKVLNTSYLKKPYYIITIGAYKTTDVNFDTFNISYDNYFDESGRGQKSPGIYLNVPHHLMQKEVNKIKGY